MSLIASAVLALLAVVLVPARWAGVFGLILLGGTLLVAALVLASVYSYTDEARTGLFLLQENLDERGIRRAVVVGYGAIVGGILKAVHCVLAGIREGDAN